jgi:transposase
MTDKEILSSISNLTQKLDAAMTEIVLLKEENLSLKEEIRVLKTGKNSSNSSKPTSSNIVNISKSLREKSVKTSGGQLGHEGKTLEFKAIPDFI